MTNPHDKALQAAANELLAHGEFGTFEEANRRNAVSAAGAAISAYLSSIGGIVCASEPVGYAYRDKRWDGDHWHLCGSDSKPRAFEGRTISSAHLPIEAGNGGDGWLDISSAPKDGTYILAVVIGNHPITGAPFIPEVVCWESGDWWNEMWAETLVENGGPYEPTHYRPLPPPPSPSNEGEKP